MTGSFRWVFPWRCPATEAVAPGFAAPGPAYALTSICRLMAYCRDMPSTWSALADPQPPRRARAPARRPAGGRRARGRRGAQPADDLQAPQGAARGGPRLRAPGRAAARLRARARADRRARRVAVALPPPVERVARRARTAPGRQDETRRTDEPRHLRDAGRPPGAALRAHLPAPARRRLATRSPSPTSSRTGSRPPSTSTCAPAGRSASCSPRTRRRRAEGRGARARARAPLRLHLGRRRAALRALRARRRLSPGLHRTSSTPPIARPATSRAGTSAWPAWPSASAGATRRRRPTSSRRSGAASTTEYRERGAPSGAPLPD